MDVLENLGVAGLVSVGILWLSVGCRAAWCDVGRMNDVQLLDLEGTSRRLLSVDARRALVVEIRWTEGLVLNGYTACAVVVSSGTVPS